jgi:predicted RNA binding protein YcfA (HicA-like mRNA interferase family)
MAKLKDVLAFLRERGWSEYRHEGGSHRVWGHPDGRQITIAVHPGREIDRPTLAKILKQAGYSLREFWNQ